jgi:hypothetical protein
VPSPTKRGRRLPPEQARKHALLLIDAILKLSQETDPQAGAASEKNKDFKAWKTLVYMGELSETLAGWALDHYTGVALEGIKRINPATSESLRTNPEYLAYTDEINSHENELAGLACDVAKVPPGTARRVVASCLAANPAGIDRHLNRQLVAALKALDFGETLDLFKPDQEALYKKVRWQELQFQLQAVAFVGLALERRTLRKR